MEVLRDRYCNKSKSFLRVDGGHDLERQRLIEEQRLCRARARKLTLETNRRRKALEEKQKQWDIQERQQRENILLQRRQEFQNATERFRAAIRPQRCKQSFRGHVPSLEDAINQIQGPKSSGYLQSCLMPSISKITRSCAFSPKPPTCSKSFRLPPLSPIEAYTRVSRSCALSPKPATSFKSFYLPPLSPAEAYTKVSRSCAFPPKPSTYSESFRFPPLSPVVAYTKLLEKKTMTCVIDHHETEKTQEKPQDQDSQNSSFSASGDSGTISHKDSLEIKDSRKPDPLLVSNIQKDFCPPSEPIPLTENHLETKSGIETVQPINTILCDIQSDIQKSLICSVEEEQKLPVPEAESDSVHRVISLKGILKKQSKYDSGNVTCGSGNFSFSEEVALAINDSVELTRTRTKAMEGNKTVRNKIRWLDEEDVEKEGADEVKGPYTSNWTNALRILKKERAARSHSLLQTRKGIVLRPPSATELKQILKTGEKIITPHPPPKMKLEKDKLRRQTLESGQVGRKPFEEKSIQPPGSGNRRLPQCAQPTKLTAEPVRPFSSLYNMPTTDKGLERRTPFPRPGANTEGILDTRQTQRPGMVQKSTKPQKLTNISMEEKEILLSLNRLDQKLICVQNHVALNSGRRDSVGVDGPSSREVKVTEHQKNRLPSASNRSGNKRKV